MCAHIHVCVCVIMCVCNKSAMYHDEKGAWLSSQMEAWLMEEQTRQNVSFIKGLKILQRSVFVSF